ncbi:transmembrane protein 70 homolog, mitochondrial [Octopus sinensis]|uniref:Transmembrane protein 70 homolog, mitochondrial n=1 Tax=Octopus sinensis TaxID=2607531 RepID=A0A6P7SBL3_9MOLL|nr:transmembrane protein 70 homolog, mitochondrial [Octopus sinensis]
MKLSPVVRLSVEDKMLMVRLRLNTAPAFLNRILTTSGCNIFPNFQVSKFHSSLKPYQAEKLSIPKDEFTNQPLYDPTKGKLIYSGPLTKTIKAVKLFSISTSLLGLGMQPVILYNSVDTSLPLKAAVSVFFAFFIVVTPLLIHMVSKKYVTDVYFEDTSNVFTAATFNLFSMRKQLTFKAEDVNAPTLTGPFTSVIIKGKPLFLDPKFFLDKQSYIHLMGFDKPLDLELPKSIKQQTEK